MLRKIYLSPLGILISLLLQLIAFFKKPIMVYGYYNRVTRKFNKHTRYSSSVVLGHKNNLNISNHVWIGHYCLLDGVGGIEIEEGVQVASHTCMYSHSSHTAIRLMGEAYIATPIEERIGYVKKSIKVGAYTFIGTQSVLLPGTQIGKGCIIGSGSVVSGVIPDYSVASGNPAVVTNDTRKIDKAYLLKNKKLNTYYDKALASTLTSQ